MSSTAVPLVGEPLALDLMNTRARLPDGRELDLLASAETFQAWLDAQRGRLGTTSGDIDLHAVRELREHIARAVDDARHGTRPPARALEALTAAQRKAPAYTRLAWDGAAVTGWRARDGNPTRRVLAELAEAAMDLLTDPSVRRIRQCEGPHCRLLFLPAHPRRRWCSPASCGNRVRVARYYQRHRDDAPAPGPAAGPSRSNRRRRP
jgi:predicted RNA-binding Zn ribbon-like protein